MIIEFTVENYRSIKEQATLSLEAESLKVQDSVVIPTKLKDLKLLPVIGVFGPNASGKSNIYKALFFMQWAMQNSNLSNPPITAHPLFQPFLLDSKSAQKPSFFQIVLWNKKKSAKYRYGFELSPTRVVSEWLETTQKVKTNWATKLIFTREADNYTFHKSMERELQPLTKRVRENALALTIFADFADELSQDVLRMIKSGPPHNYLTMLEGSANLPPNYAFERYSADKEFAARALKFMQNVGIQMEGMEVLTEQVSNSEVPPQLRQMLNLQMAPTIERMRVVIKHKVYGQTNKSVEFDLGAQESKGTQNLFALTPLMLNALETGGVLVFDELGSNLHPYITRAIVSQFQDPKINSHGAQLIFFSHDTYLLSSAVNLRRDQIWFTDKDKQESTLLRSLAEYKTRSDYEIAKNYLEGRFGAVPLVRFLED